MKTDVLTRNVEGSLYLLKKGKTATIRRIDLQDDIKRALQERGFSSGRSISILSENQDNFIVRVGEDLPQGLGKKVITGVKVDALKGDLFESVTAKEQANSFLGHVKGFFSKIASLIG